MSSNHRLVGVVVILLLALGLSSCGGGIITFSFTEESDEQVVEGQSLPGPDLLQEPLSFNINLEKKLEKRDAKGAKRVELRDLKLKITDTEMQGDDTDNFNFLDSIEFRVASDSQPNKKIAWLDSVPKGKQTLSLNVDSSINLKPYIEDGMTLKTNAEGSLKGAATIWVKAL
ncbi:MAG: hypothetical protein ABEN55_14510 [Bradymonadaceae bacterium]